MAEYFAGGHLRFLNGEWRDDNGDVVYIKQIKPDKSRCRKCFHKGYCLRNRDNEGKCPDYKRDAPDGGYYG